MQVINLKDVNGVAASKAMDSNKRGKAGAKIKSFFKGCWIELKKVHWPAKRQIGIYTGVVIGTVFAAAIAISLVDSILSFLLGFVLR